MLDVITSVKTLLRLSSAEKTTDSRWLLKRPF